jgi:hypothetical protein
VHAGPDFLIVGAGRAGTTTLYRWLRRHPGVFMPDDKEPGYFVHDHGVNDLAAYERLFAPAGARLKGEASTLYLTCPESAAWIRRELGDIPIFILLRDPVARCFSMYVWMYQNGWEPITVFERALAAEPVRRGNPSVMAPYKKCVCDDYQYFESGLYSAQVRNYQEKFSSVHVLLLDDLHRDPQGTFDGVCGVLGLPHAAIGRPGATNGSKRPRWPSAQFRLRRAVERCDRRSPPGGRELKLLLLRVMALNVWFGEAVKVRPDTAAELRVRYAEDVRRTSELIGRDLSAWLPPHDVPVTAP